MGAPLELDIEAVAVERTVEQPLYRQIHPHLVLFHPHFEDLAAAATTLCEIVRDTPQVIIPAFCLGYCVIERLTKHPKGRHSKSPSLLKEASRMARLLAMAALLLPMGTAFLPGLALRSVQVGPLGRRTLLDTSRAKPQVPSHGRGLQDRGSAVFLQCSDLAVPVFGAERYVLPCFISSSLCILQGL